MRLLIVILWLAGAGGGIAVAREVPLPRPRPPIWTEPQSFREIAGPDFDSTGITSEPTECDKRIRTIAVVESLPRLIGPGACGGSDMLRLEAALRPDGARIELRPAPVLRCEFAESVAAWLRDEAAPRVDKLGALLRAVETFDDFECRGRNRVSGAKLSEHGKGNAVDLRAFLLADGRSLGLTDISVAKDFREEIRDSACHRFTTVLGPGADAYHESHIHLDLLERRQGYRMCQWDVREPPKTEIVAQVPLPPPRPAVPVAR
ncbi:MAG TPA: extensin family protein [Pseudolabrys sp.]|nr:extensin family protein [Pseudolabrys sp.]